jgi:hypothetical protein
MKPPNAAVLDWMLNVQYTAIGDTKAVRQWTSSVLLLARNSQRLRLMIDNQADENLVLFVSQAAADGDLESFLVPPRSTFDVSDYLGELHGKWQGHGDGQAVISELSHGCEHPDCALSDELARACLKERKMIK